MKINEPGILKEGSQAEYFYDIRGIEGDLGAKLENIAAGALLREIHLMEDITGRKGKLFNLRDKKKNEVDFLVVLEKKPWMMIKVKTGTDHFAKSFFHFQKRLSEVKAVQVVYPLDRNRSSQNVNMLKMEAFLQNLDF